MVRQRKHQEESRSSQDCNYPIHISFSLASNDAPGAGTKATLCGNPAEIPLFYHPGGGGCQAVWEQGSQLGSQPWALGMLENKYIPFRKSDRQRFDIIDSVHKWCSSAWKGQRVTMQFQYSGSFDCFSLAFLSICQKNRQRFANESLILKLLKFSFEGQLYNCQHPWRMQGTGYTVSLEIGCTCIIFFGDKSQMTYPPTIPESCMNVHKKYSWSVRSNGLVSVQLWNWIWLQAGAGILPELVFLLRSSVLFSFLDTYI